MLPICPAFSTTPANARSPCGSTLTAAPCCLFRNWNGRTPSARMRAPTSSRILNFLACCRRSAPLPSVLVGPAASATRPGGRGSARRRRSQSWSSPRRYPPRSSPLPASLSCPRRSHCTRRPRASPILCWRQASGWCARASDPVVNFRRRPNSRHTLVVWAWQRCTLSTTMWSLSHRLPVAWCTPVPTPHTRTACPPATGCAPGAPSCSPRAVPSAGGLSGGGRGEFLMLWGGCGVGGGFVGGERTFVLGEPSFEQRRYHDAVRLAQEIGGRAIYPGREGRGANRDCLNVIRDAGLGGFLRHRQGHGIGLGMHEPPWLEDGDVTPLEVGMIVSNEPGIYIPGHAGYRISDSMLVTEDGARPLTSFPRDLASCTISL